MADLRLIARLDIKSSNVIKGVNLEGLRKVGKPGALSQKYYIDGADELIYMDTVASLYGRNNLIEFVKEAAQNIFIPLTVGGGVRSAEDVRALLNAGADKIAINTAAINNPSLIKELSERFGSQCITVSIEAMKKGDSYEAYTDNGREKTGKDVLEWAKEVEKLGAGEILLTSIRQEGTRKGFDLELTKLISEAVNIPVIASGGMGEMEHLKSVYSEGKADAIAIADIIHFERKSFPEIRSWALENNIPVRRIEVQ